MLQWSAWTLPLAETALFWCMITLSLSFLLVLLISLCVLDRKDDEKVDLHGNKAPQGLEALHHAFVRKLLPIGPETKWSLTGVYQELRLWKQVLNDEAASGRIHYLYGCSSAISASPEDVMDTLQDVNQTVEWDSQVLEVDQVSMPTCTGLDLDHSVMTDVVTETLKSPGTLRLFLSKLKFLIKVPYLFLTGKTIQLEEIRSNRIARTWQKEHDGCCWMFCKKVNKGIVLESLPDIWTYFYIRPILGDDGGSILHYILCIESDLSETPEIVASRVAAIKHYFTLKKLSLPPLKRKSLKHVTEGFGSSSKQATSVISVTESSPDIFQAGNTESQALGSSPSHDASCSSKPVVGQGDDAQVSWTWDSSSDDTGFQSDGMPAPVRRKNKAHKASKQNLSSFGRGRFMSSGENVDYRTLANHSAGEVLEEALKAGVINVNTSESDQQLQTGGWTFQRLEKDVVILKKKERGSRFYSFLGKGLIRASPESVFKAVKNPRTRFIYDNMLKKMNIVRDLGNDLLIYNMVHEVPQIIRKESRDFCLLQTSRTDGQRHIVAARSVDWPECPPSKDGVVRSKILPSGWVIEPVLKKNEVNSVVTYIVQIDVGGKDVPQSFLQFLSRRIPLSVAYLRLFLEAELP
ncbi:uncharacterized protein LOC117111641 isoform X3 [Anneissia japonica]|uniref:uncharacterized protein LOC117111641 isoform X3 n=1 Tax=Anneissia japonica TaxID=1529436 RepID=UPI001425547A|nr:uncharacterized protein LOC117111641 isoform X3 [Anneissia japonica]